VDGESTRLELHHDGWAGFAEDKHTALIAARKRMARR
jgi:hypothetical protein